MINTQDILQTMQMIREEHFDIRTITLGINLLPCASEDVKRTAERVYDKITKTAEHLVRTGEDIEKEFGIPIVNKRIAVTPVSMIAQGDPVPIAFALDRAAKQVGVNFLGGYTALMQKGATDSDERLIRNIRRDVVERGRTVDMVLDRYLNVLKPMHDQFIEPTKKYADLIIPQGGENLKGIGILCRYIEGLVPVGEGVKR